MPRNDLPSKVERTFNQVPSKIVRLDDLATQMDVLEQKGQFSSNEKLAAKAEWGKLGERAQLGGGAGLYTGTDVDGKQGAFIDSRFIAQGLVALATEVKPGSPAEATIAKVDSVFADALIACKDQSPQLVNGQIKPETMPKPTAPKTLMA
jgi:hypothetical protein